MLERIARRFELSTSELRHAVALGAILFAITSSYTLAKTARDALYLASLPASTLPYVYLGVGAVTVTASVLFGRLTQRAATWQTLAGTALVAALSLAGFAWLLPLERRWVPVAFYMWVNVYGLILTSQFWAFTNSLSDPREAKRIFGIIGGGGILGGLVGGIVAARLGSTATLPALLAVAALLVALAMPGVWAGVRRGTVPVAEPEPEQTGPAPLRVRYVRWLAAATLCSVLVTGLLDYQFKTEVQVRYDRAALAHFFGMFYTVTNLVALTFQVFATRWMLQRLGAGWSAAVLPAGLGAGALATITSPGFATVLGTRLWDQTMRLSLNKSAAELFYFPLEPGLRRRAKALIEAGIERFGDGLAGAMILLAGLSPLGANTLTLALLVAALVMVWMAAWWVIRRGYVQELGRNLRRMNLDPSHERVSLREAGLRGAMGRLLESPWGRVVLHGVELLEDNAPELLARRLPALLAHPSPAVRAQALTVAARRWPERVRAQLPALLTDPDPFVRLAALRVHANLGETPRLDALESYLDAPDVRLRGAALAVIMELAGESDAPRVRRRIAPLLASDDPAFRAMVAEALGARPAPSALLEPLPGLLDDPDPHVRRAALRAAGNAGLRTAVPRLIDALGEPGDSGAARGGLAPLGDRVVGTLGDYLIDPTVALEVRREIPRVLGDIGTQQAVHALFRARDRRDVPLSTRILEASTRIRNAHPHVSFPAALVTEDITHDVRSHLFALVNYRSCPLGARQSGERLLCIALNERMDQALARAFRRLSLLYHPREIMAAWHGIGSTEPRARGHALEYLENALAPEHRELVMPLVDDIGDDDRQTFAETRFGLQYHGHDASLAALLHSEDAWLRTLAIYVVGARRLRALRAPVEAGLEDPDRRVRETATWAWRALAAA
jgi:ATP:ADP antiporter, AAA family